MRRAPTPAEAVLWRALRRGQLDGLHFRRQQVIDGFIADFYCHAACLIVEVDGPVHCRVADDDAERDRVLMRRGLRIVRVSNADVFERLTTVLAEIAAATRSGSPLPPGEGSGER